MKSIILTLVAFVIAMTSCIPLVDCVHGNGTKVTEKRIPATFTTIVNSTAIDIVFNERDTFGIILEVEENLLPYIVTEVTGNSLEIRNKRGYGCIRFTRDPVIRISAPFLNGITLSGSGNLEADRLEDSEVAMRISGSGNIVVDHVIADYSQARITGSGDLTVRNLNCIDLESVISGSGDVNITGKGTSGSFRITGSGNLYAREFEIQNSSATISGSGNLYTWTTGMLNAGISGSGNIYFKGDPQIISNITGSGRIIKFK